MKLAIKLVGFFFISAKSTSQNIEWTAGNCWDLANRNGPFSWLEGFSKNLNGPEELIRKFEEFVKEEPPANLITCRFAYIALVETFVNWFFTTHGYARENVLAIQSSVSAADDGGYCTKFKTDMEHLWVEKPMDTSYNFNRWILCPEVYSPFTTSIRTGIPRILWCYNVLDSFLSSHIDQVADPIEQLNAIWGFLGIGTHNFGSSMLGLLTSRFVQASRLSLDMVPTIFDNGMLFIGAKRVCEGVSEYAGYNVIVRLCFPGLESILGSGSLEEAITPEEWEQHKYPEVIEWALGLDTLKDRANAITYLARFIDYLDIDELRSVSLIEFKNSRRNLDLFCSHLRDNGWFQGATEFLLLICQYPRETTCAIVSTFPDGVASSALGFSYPRSLSRELNLWSEAGLFTFDAEPDCESDVVYYAAKSVSLLLSSANSGKPSVSVAEMEAEIKNVPSIRQGFCSLHKLELEEALEHDRDQGLIGQWLPIVCPNIDIPLKLLNRWSHSVVVSSMFDNQVRIRSSHVVEDSLSLLLDRYTTGYEDLPIISLDDELGSAMNPKWIKAFTESLYDQDGRSLKSDLSQDVYFAFGRLMAFCMQAQEPIAFTIPPILDHIEEGIYSIIRLDELSHHRLLIPPQQLASSLSYGEASTPANSLPRRADAWWIDMSD